jgi:hypothetical protein
MLLATPTVATPTVAALAEATRSVVYILALVWGVATQTVATRAVGTTQALAMRVLVRCLSLLARSISQPKNRRTRCQVVPGSWAKTTLP